MRKTSSIIVQYHGEFLHQTIYQIYKAQAEPERINRMKKVVKINQPRHTVLERDMMINGITVHVKSVFNNQTTLDKALKNIILRKSSEQENVPA